MRDDLAILGAQDALQQYGCEKLAAIIPQLKAFGAGAANFLVGQPGTALKQFRNNKLMAPGGLLREAVTPKSAIHAAMMYGLPAISGYAALQSPSSQRGSSVGEFLGSTIGSTLGAPLGMIGQMAGSSLVGGVGRTLGSVFDKKPAQVENAEPTM